MNEKTLQIALRRRILELAAELGLTPTALARRAGLSHATLGNILTGRDRSTTLRTVLLICQAADLTLPDFFASPHFQDLEWDEK